MEIIYVNNYLNEYMPVMSFNTTKIGPWEVGGIRFLERHGVLANMVVGFLFWHSCAKSGTCRPVHECPGALVAHARG